MISLFVKSLKTVGVLFVESEAMRIKVLGTTFNFKCDKSRKLAEATLISWRNEAERKPR